MAPVRFSRYSVNFPQRTLQGGSVPIAVQLVGSDSERDVSR